MSYSRQRFHPRKSIDDFLAENLLNRILYESLKKNNRFPEATILTAFNEAYQTCIDVLAEPERQTLYSDNLGRMAANAPRSSLLRLCLTFFILSFHKEAPSLRHYLANLKEALVNHLPEVFMPLMTATSALSPKPVTIDDSSPEPIPERKPDSVKISNLIKKAQELPKHDADIVLKTLQIVIAEESDDWKELVRLAIEQNNARIEHAPPRSRYRLADRQTTTFVKIMRIIYDLHLFETFDGTIVSNFEDFVVDIGAYFNTPIKSPSNLLSAAKRTDNFMQVFNRIRDLAQAFYTQGDALFDS